MPDHRIITFQRKSTEPSRCVDTRQCGLDSVGLMKFDKLPDVHIAYSVTIGEAEGLLAEILANPLQAAASHCAFTRINQRNAPWLRERIVNFHLVRPHVKRYIGRMEEVVGKVFLDHIAFVTATYYEVVQTIMRIDLHNMP